MLEQDANIDGVVDLKWCGWITLESERTDKYCMPKEACDTE